MGIKKWHFNKKGISLPADIVNEQTFGSVYNVDDDFSCCFPDLEIERDCIAVAPDDLSPPDANR
jgi:hypothetical protein